MSIALRIVQLEDEFNSPFAAIVKSFADAGHSFSDTVDLLDLRRASARSLFDSMGWSAWFGNGYKSVRSTEARSNRTMTLIWSKALKKSAARRVKRFEYKGVYDTKKGHAEHYGLTVRALDYRRKKNIPFEYIGR